MSIIFEAGTSFVCVWLALLTARKALKETIAFTKECRQLFDKAFSILKKKNKHL